MGKEYNSDLHAGQRLVGRSNVQNPNPQNLSLEHLGLGKCLLGAPMPESEARVLDPDWMPDVPFNDPPVSAAVLIALVRRAHGYGVVFTQRSSGLRAHSGQIAFPGGKLDAGDPGPGAGALREAHEEIALVQENARILGYLPAYVTGTNYLITPVVAEVFGDPVFTPNPLEVDEIFEVPLGFLLDKGNYSHLKLERNGHKFQTWQLIFKSHTIWGITANLARKFADMTLSGQRE
ncbi:MAG TPA: CoA pyrophosphatase [Devosia sp.]|nr:CoA pyrophosphatase [Devosia sp.]